MGESNEWENKENKQRIEEKEEARKKMRKSCASQGCLFGSDDDNSKW